MPWYFPWSESIKKRACRYLLQRYLGHFLKEKLTLDQLSVDLYNGKGTIKDLSLDVVSLNEALDSYNVPFEIVDGFIGSITVDIPWSALVNDNTSVEVSNLELTVQPKQREDRAGGMLESMFTSMTSSLELAQECLRQDTTEGEQHAETAQPFDGLEMFAMTIEAVLSRIKMTFSDTVIRLEHLPKDAKTGAALELRIQRIEYFDDIAAEPGSPVDQPKGSSASNQGVYEPPAISHKNIHLMGVSLLCDEFPDTHRTQSKVVTTQAASQQKFSVSVSPPQSVPLMNLNLDSPEGKDTSDPIKIAELMGKQEVKLKIKQNEELPGPKMEVECVLGIFNLHLSPRQVHLLLEISSGLTAPDPCDNTSTRPRRSLNRPMDPEDEEKVELELQKRLQTTRLTRLGSPGPGLGHGLTELDEPFATQSLEDSEDEMYFDLDGQSVSISMTSSVSSTGTMRSTSTASTRSSYNPAGYSRRDAPFQSTIPRSGRSRPKTKHKDSLHKLLDDTSSDLAKYKLRVSFLSAMVLHEDPPTTPSDALDPGQTSAEKLRELSDKYFSRVKGINTSGYGTTLASLRAEFSKACPMDHISILVKPLSFECNQRCSSSVTTTSAELTLGHAEVVEALFDRRGATASIMGFHLPIENILPDYCELLIFPEDELPKTQQMFSSLHVASGPSIKVKVQAWEKIHQSPRRHSYSSTPKAEVHVELGRCRCEVDVSLMDRIHALLNPQPLTKTVHSVYMSAYKSFHTGAQSQHALFNQTLDEASPGSDRPTDFRISSPLCTVTVRFPIPDLRSSTGVDKPWWRRCLREEKVLLEFTEADFQSSIHKGEPLSKIEFTCREGKAMFQEKPDKEPVPFIYVAKADSSAHDREEGFDWPRVELRLFPKLQSQLEEVAEEVEDSSNGMDSLNGACQFEPPPPSPFSGKKVLYDNDELVLPGDRRETAQFQEKCLSRTEISLDLNLPNVNIYLQDKDFFELIYNRLLNDLVLWEPVAPAPLDVGEQYSFAKGPGWSVDTVTPFMQHNQGPETFSVCKSGIKNDSSSESDNDVNEFYSTAEFRSKHRQKQNQDLGKKSKLCLNLVVGRGRFTARCPSKGEDAQPVPGRHGELCLDVVDGCFFTVVQTNGDPELQHMCVHVHRAALHHSGDLPDSAEVVTLGRTPTSIVPPEHLAPTMYLSDPGVETRLSGQVGRGNDSQDMLSVAVQVRIDMLTNVEECLVALGVKGTTLLHKMTPSNQSWFDQLVDFFDVKEYPVLGYSKPQIVTQLHAHLWSCCVDYRPLYLPYRTILTLETFSISSNVVAESPTCKLRFRVEDGALYLSQHLKYRHSKEVDLRRDYVCVADVGVFEIILTTSDGRDPKYPKLDLRVTNNILHIRTCSDSCQALAELINYMADLGDMTKSRDGSSQYGSTMLTHSASSSTLSESPQLSQSHMEQVHDMMADAMRESSSSSLTSSKDSSPEKDTKDPTEVFFFPGEGSTVRLPLPDPAPAADAVAGGSQYSDSDEDSIERSLSQLSGQAVLGRQADDFQASTDDAGSLVSSRESFQDEMDQPPNADDEYCIIDDPGLGIASRDGEPKIRILTNNPIQVIDNHFQMPLGKTDQLKAPKHFPPAVYKYTLQEMSVVWYMYGGRDFPTTITAKSVSSKPATGAKHKPKSVGKLMWQARGGEERDIDTLLELQLTKVRLQHEIFPENTEQASRQIILIHEVEIRDRLVSSKINKFLYQFTSGAMPRQSHANMVLVKAVQLRPDPTVPSLECSLRVSLQPLRFNIDQDSLFFLRTFFSDLSRDVSDSEADLPPVVGTPPKPASLSSTPQKAPAPPPVMIVGQPEPETEESPQDLIKFDEMLETALDEDGDEDDDEESVPRETPIFFKSFMFSPDVPIRLDYHGKRVDMEQGTLAGLLVGLAHLNCSELRLKRLHHRHGLLGFNRLVVYAMNEWLNDIKRNQLPSILGGVGPLHSLVQLVQGMRDLFWLPVEQYRKDGRIIRGIQRGAHSFATCTAMSALELTNRVVQTVQYFAEVAYDMVSPGPSVRKKKYRKKLRRLTHPADLREGVSNAYSVVTQGFKSTAETIYHTAVDEHEQKGVTGAVGGVLRQLPPTVLQPFILVTEATSNVLGGMRNQLLPDKKKEDEDKWKPEED